MYRLVYIPTGDMIDRQFAKLSPAQAYLRYLVCMSADTSHEMVKEEFEIIETDD